MDFVPLRELVEDALQRKYAVPGFCAWNAEVMEAVLETAARLRSPVIVMNGPGEFPLLKPVTMALIARAVKSRHSVPAALHLDHGDTMETVRACLDARYTSVMLDYSARSFEENVKGLKEVARLARPVGITVEGECGKVGRVDGMSAEGDHGSILTDPISAARYVEQTNVDLLAVAIGNAHGEYRGKPNLDFRLLERIREQVPVPLVLHGGTGIPEADLKKAISLGIAKVNVATELINTVRDSLLGQWKEGENLWTPLAMAQAMKSLSPVVEKWIRMLGSDGKA